MNEEKKKLINENQQLKHLLKKSVRKIKNLRDTIEKQQRILVKYQKAWTILKSIREETPQSKQSSSTSTQDSTSHVLRASEEQLDNQTKSTTSKRKFCKNPVDEDEDDTAAKSLCQQTKVNTCSKESTLTLKAPKTPQKVYDNVSFVCILTC